ncbi:MAG: hypothetical protein WBD81_18610 [Collimonas pratensis]|uniref:hypothetical protein n=1 Tax=Collimonas pratensis TaxID=279113 RepID=UPI003C71777D
MMMQAFLAIHKAVFQAHLQHSATLVKIRYQSMTSGESSALVHKVIPKICGELYAQRRQNLPVFTATGKIPFKS